ncbi:GRAM domain-containing protein 4-like [Diadema antillarum]|uniref:GRAM domain-containing protein 4-like n=1 Tax=Diadema antillarum TaxID=105358 RepID=UPI003A8A475F
MAVKACCLPYGLGDFLGRWKQKVFSKDHLGRGDPSAGELATSASQKSLHNGLTGDRDLASESRRDPWPGREAQSEILKQALDQFVADIVQHSNRPNADSNDCSLDSEAQSDDQSSVGGSIVSDSTSEGISGTTAEEEGDASFPSRKHHRTNAHRVRSRVREPKMPLKPQLSMLRNRFGHENKAAAQIGVSHEGREEWANITVESTSMPTCEPDVTSISVEDAMCTGSQKKSKSSLEDHAPQDPSFHQGGAAQREPPFEDAFSEMSDASQVASRSSWDGNQKKVYEMQLENLQEQLVDIMIENQTLAQKLQRYENSDIIPLLRKLEDERERNELLNQRCRTLEDRYKNNRMTHQISGDAEEVNAPTTTLCDESSLFDGFDSPPPTRWEKIQSYVMERVWSVISDMTEEADEAEPEPVAGGDELTVKKLKENLKRFKAGYEPGLLFCRAMAAAVSWKSPACTVLVFLLYVYVVWRGWCATVVLGLMIWYLTTTYFISRGWIIQFSLLPYHLVEVTPDEGPPLSMSDRFQLVLHVSRKVQNLLGHLADQMEKIRNFLYWTNEDLTKQLYRNLVVAFIVSLFVSGSSLLLFIGLFLGVKIFLMNPVLRRYPRLKARYSFEEKLFREVPTNAELERRLANEEREQFLVPDIEGITIRAAEEESLDSRPASKRWKAFSQSFSLPESEQPLPGWKDGKRCTLITKNTRAGAFKNGRLYLTKSFLCFEKSRLVKEGNMMIPFKDVQKIEKAKPFGFMPGSGMSIQVHLSSSDKPILFGGILGRDAVYDKICQTWQAAKLALQHQNSQNQSQSQSQREQVDTRESRSSTMEAAPAAAPEDGSGTASASEES